MGCCSREAHARLCLTVLVVQPAPANVPPLMLFLAKALAPSLTLALVSALRCGAQVHTPAASVPGPVGSPTILCTPLSLWSGIKAEWA